MTHLAGVRGGFRGAFVADRGGDGITVNGLYRCYKFTTIYDRVTSTSTGRRHTRPTEPPKFRSNFPFD
jgi:hypothetical protein